MGNVKSKLLFSKGETEGLSSGEGVSLTYCSGELSMLAIAVNLGDSSNGGGKEDMTEGDEDERTVLAVIEQGQYRASTYYLMEGMLRCGFNQCHYSFETSLEK